MSVLRRTVLAGAAFVCLLICVSVAIAGSAKPRVDVIASYTHPDPNPGYSWVCVKVKGTKKTVLTVTVTGGHVLGARTKKATIKRTSGVIVAFKIDTPAGYDFSVSGTLAGTTTKTASVNVPQPGDGTPSGPFRCA